MTLLLGYTCAGKDTVLKELQKMGYKIVVSWTTRKKRPNEIGGVDYNFCTEEEFKRLDNIGFFAETTSYTIADGSTVYYGTAVEDLSDDKVAVVNPEGFKKLSKLTTLKPVSFLLTCSEDVLKERLENRGDDPAEAERRLMADHEDFWGIKTDYTINNNGELSPKDVAEIVDYIYKKRIGV